MNPTTGIVLALFLVLPDPIAAAQSLEGIEDEVDRFAVRHLHQVQALSIRDNREYCGIIGFDVTGRIKATGPHPGEMDSCDPGEDPPGFQAIASYHTHGAFSPDADSEVPSVDDLLGDFEEGIDGYVATPSGRVWVNVLEDRTSYLLCGPGCVRSDPAFRPCNAFLPGDKYTVPSLEIREETDPGYC